MTENEFYYPSGEKIKSNEEFIRFYSESYYISNSKFVENEIDRILKEGAKSADLPRILAWKLGRINHRESNADKKFAFSDKFNESDYSNLTKIRNGKTVNINKLCEMLGKDLPEDSVELFKKLIGNSENSGLGTVYLLTILYFLTKGKEPIYDRFSMIGITAIDQKLIPGARVPYCQLPSLSEIKGNAERIFKNNHRGSYGHYKYLLNYHFNEIENYNRNLDRALWVYGHLFSEKKWDRKE